MTGVTQMLISFFMDILADSSLKFPLELRQLQEWASDDGEEFEGAVILALGFTELGWDTPDETSVSEQLIATTLAELGANVDELHAEGADRESGRIMAPTSTKLWQSRRA